MDNDKKKFLAIGIAIIAVVAVAFSFTSSGIAGEKEEKVGSLENGYDKGKAPVELGQNPDAAAKPKFDEESGAPLTQ